MKMFLGIDPGKNGALARLYEDNKFFIFPTPIKGKEYDISEMSNLIGACSPEDNDIFCMIERAQSMPKQGVVSMFEFGKGYGIWLGILACYKIPYQIVHSRVWTKCLLEGCPGEGKDRNIFAAKRLFPDWQPKLKKEMNYCDSLLLAEYGRRKNEGRS